MVKKIEMAGLGIQNLVWSMEVGKLLSENIYLFYQSSITQF